jgi:type II secretion system protein J
VTPHRLASPQAQRRGRTFVRWRGFTLLELLIAVAITATLMAMVGAILVRTLETDERISSMLATDKTGYGILNVLRRDLQACYCYSLGGPAFKGERASLSGGEADKVAFVTAAEGLPDPKTGSRPKLQRVGYRLESEQGRTSLYRYAEAYTEGDPLAPATYSLVAGGLRSLKLSYLDPNDLVWKDGDWSETDRVPLAVKVKVELVPDDEDPDKPKRFGVSGPTFEMVVGVPTVAAIPEDPPADTKPK